jgi:tripartite-type tricarboxylate transporter receptor subunit TctC
LTPELPPTSQSPAAARVRATARLLAQTLATVLDHPDVHESWARIGLTVDSSSPDQLRAMMHHEYDFWGALVKASGITPET